MTFEEKTLSSEMIYEGKILNLRKDKVTTVNGTSYREIIEHNGAAVMAAITDEGKMVMVRQFRKAAEKIMLEAPAGKIDPGEDARAAALRELREETGYDAGHIELLTKFYPSVGYCAEKLYLYLCTELTAGDTDFDESEAIDIEEIEIDELYKMAMNGEIDDGKTAIAIFMVRELALAGKFPGYKK